MTQSSLKKLRDEKIAYWQPHIAAWQESKISTKEYCQQHQLAHSRFKYWQNELTPKREFKENPSPIFSFAEVNIDASALPLENSIELMTPQGYSLRVTNNFNEHMLSRLLNLLKQL
jgi:hypothetical protein